MRQPPLPLRSNDDHVDLVTQRSTRTKDTYVRRWTTKQCNTRWNVRNLLHCCYVALPSTFLRQYKCYSSAHRLLCAAIRQPKKGRKAEYETEGRQASRTQESERKGVRRYATKASRVWKDVRRSFVDVRMKMRRNPKPRWRTDLMKEECKNE